MSQLRQPLDPSICVSLRERPKGKNSQNILSESLQVDFSDCNLRGFDLAEMSLNKVT